MTNWRGQGKVGKELQQYRELGVAHGIRLGRFSEESGHSLFFMWKRHQALVTD